MLYHGDCLDVMATLEANSIDSIVTDPPYGLEFMGKDWDHGVPGIPFWAEALRVAKPGAALLAFGGTRTHHRLMCAIEDAGWEIRDVVMYLYGSGFPKSHDISKAIDKAAGAEREVVGQRVYAEGHIQNSSDDKLAPPIGTFVRTQDRRDITSPATSAAALWDGWGTALKPAYEPIIVAMKPRDGTFANNALEWGVAGINVDGCRVPTNDKLQKLHGSFSFAGSGGANETGKSIEFVDAGKGRWPANLVLSHTPECRQVGVRKVKSQAPIYRRDASEAQEDDGMIYGAMNPQPANKQIGYASPDGTETIPAWECAPGCPVRLLDEMSGERKSPGNYKRSTAGEESFKHKYNGGRPFPDEHIGYGDTGGASRFFYTAKASRKERNLGLGDAKNTHPTVKPLELMRWLCRLTATPTGGVVLDPFMGSGTTGMAAVLEGREFVGIELERESFEIAQARIAWAREQVPGAVQLELI